MLVGFLDTLPASSETYWSISFTPEEILLQKH